jgi:hypothetical protein
MLKESEISLLINNKSFRNACYRIAKGMQEDLISHVVLILLELPEKEIKKINNITAYACAIAFSEFKNRKSLFNKSIGLVESAELTGIEIESKEDIDNTFDIIIKVIDKEYYRSIAKDRFPVAHELFKAYLELKTIRAVSTHFGISRSTVGRHIKEYKELINKHYETIN